MAHKGKHIAIFGNVALIRGYCLSCRTTCIILDEEKQCCGEKEILPELTDLPVKRMSNPAYKRIRLPKWEREQILKEQHHRCIYCGILFGSIYTRGNRVKILKTRTHFDHFIPFAFSSNNKSTNMVAACNLCNHLKSDKMFNNLEEVSIYVESKREEKKIKYL